MKQHNSHIHRFLAPAKINTYLYVVGKREDGYHLLDTEFQLIDLFDTVQLRVRSDDKIVLHTPIAGLADDKHLAVRAAQALKQATGNTFGVDIWVEKHIPTGAGLGGGSSDAASTLLALNRMWGCNLSSEELQTLGLGLGADVPFFCSMLGTAKATGIGEVLLAVPTREQHYVFIYPDCHVSTPAVFKHPNLTLGDKSAIIAGLADKNLKTAGKASEFESPLRYHNDLQVVAQLIAPPIGQAIQCLINACEHELLASKIDVPHTQGLFKQPNVCMSGSGSAVFAVFDTMAAAQAVQNRVKCSLPENAKSWQMGCVSSLQTHPMYDCLSSLK